MLHEEFERLTGIEVSYRYYTNEIEPDYAELDIDKEAFCTQWMKEHKGDICKTLGADFDGLVRDAALVDALREGLKENKRLRQDLGKKVKDFEQLNKRQAETIEHDKTTISFQRAELVKLETAHLDTAELKDTHDKDMEIIKLKAMLFDYLYKTA